MALAQLPALPTLFAGAMGDMQCARQSVTGQCYCAGIPCGLRVQRYVPVAIVETTRTPGDSLVAASGLPALPEVIGGTRSSSLSITDTTAEAHVWSFPRVPIPGVDCATCSAASAQVPILTTVTAPDICEPVARTAQAIGALRQQLDAPVLPSLLYASELDWQNWRTGCRDLAIATAQIGLAPLACAAGPEFAADNCIGRWGPLRPRQMREPGPTPPLYSAKTAVRAMSLAREQLGLFAFPVDTQGKPQQAYPALSACFAVGQLPLPQLPWSARPVSVSMDGRYAWIYWPQTTCCVGLATPAQCLVTGRR